MVAPPRIILLKKATKISLVAFRFMQGSNIRGFLTKLSIRATQEFPAYVFQKTDRT